MAPRPPSPAGPSLPGPPQPSPPPAPLPANGRLRGPERRLSRREPAFCLQPKFALRRECATSASRWNQVRAREESDRPTSPARGGSVWPEAAARSPACAGWPAARHSPLTPLPVAWRENQRRNPSENPVRGTEAWGSPNNVIMLTSHAGKPRQGPSRSQPCDGLWPKCSQLTV